jgi:hypothetical protein
MNTTENNKLIAEFMDIYPRGNDDEFSGKDIDDAGLPYEQGEIGNGFYRVLFHKSWDWLMPVVEKISKWYRTAPRDNYYKFTDACGGVEQFQSNLFDADIKLTYNAVVQFIKWHNENKNSQL